MKTLVYNKRAKFDYFFLDTFEAGIVLSGGEVKSIREGRASLQDSFVRISNGQAYLMNAHINPYNFSDNRNYDPRQSRKLLFHKKEIAQLVGKSSGKSITLIPVSIYDKHNNLKVQIALAKGKKQYDKRASIKEREVKQRIQQELKSFRK
jgi:SsrA-binding protein